MRLWLARRAARVLRQLFGGERSMTVSKVHGGRYRAFRRSILLLGALGALSQPSLAQEPPATTPGAAVLSVELNRLEAVSADACRAYFVVRNTAPEAYDSLRLDLFAFDTDGVIAARLAVDFAPLAGDKTSVKLFDFPGIACDRISQVLLNEVLACSAAGGANGACEAPVISSRVPDVTFIE
jgi:hypothetical protein